MTFRKTKEVRAYALFLLHRFVNTGNIAHEEVRNKKLIPFLEKERKRLHKEALKSVKAKKISPESKQLNTFVEDFVKKKSKKYYTKRRKKWKVLPSGYCRCGLCMKVMHVSKWKEHEKSYEHSALQRTVIKMYYPGFYKIIGDEQKIRQIDRSLKLLQEMKNKIMGVKNET